MPLHALRRWLARHSAAGVLGLALGLASLLGGAQVAAACHEIAHASALASVTADGKASHANGHECSTCLLAAALGSAATAPPAVLPPAATDALATLATRAHAFTPRRVAAYASRAPPSEGAAAA